MEALISARDLMAKTLEESNRVSTAIEASSCNIRRHSSELLRLSEGVRCIERRTSALSALSLQAEHATGPAAAYSSVVLLRRSLSAAHPSPELSSYLGWVSRLEQALAFLTENCALAIHWLNGAAASPLLDDGEKLYTSNVKRSLAVLEELKAMEARERLPGGSLYLAMDKLQIELRRILQTEIIKDDDHELVRAVVERMRANGRGSRVGPIYVEARVEAVKSRLGSKPRKYPKTLGGVAEWGRDLELVVTQVVAFEHCLCSRLSHDGIGISMDSYADVVVESGFLRMLGLGLEAAGTGKEDAMRLLKLLEVFREVEPLRTEFNRLFGGKECERVQRATRELVRGVVEGSYEIFSRLAAEVEKQPTPPSGEANVPPLVAFVTQYCVTMVEDKYKHPLLRVLAIHQTWHPALNHRLSPNQLLLHQISKVLIALELNFIKCSKTSRHSALGSSFLLNNYRYIYDHLIDSPLENLLGEQWLAHYRHKIDFYAQHECEELSSQQERITLAPSMMLT